MSMDRWWLVTVLGTRLRIDYGRRHTVRGWHCWRFTVKEIKAC